MQIDELRGELATLADEIEPFSGDVGSLHRRRRRRRIVTSSFAVALAVVVAVSVVAVSHSDNGRVHVAAGSKEVSSKLMSRFDAIVVPATPEVKAVLDASALVDRYAFIPHADRSSGSLLFEPYGGLCALQTTDGYAVEAASPGTNIQGDLQRALAGRATVYDTSDRFGVDFELFLKVDASAAQSRAVDAALQTDTDVRWVQHLSKAEAYAVFRKDFADQPALVQSTKPSDLPESFRVILQPGRSVASIVDRYTALPGVDTAITPPTEVLFDPASLPRPLQGTLVSPCAKG